MLPGVRVKSNNEMVVHGTLVLQETPWMNIELLNQLKT
jgi:hypothetical protein